MTTTARTLLSAALALDAAAALAGCGSATPAATPAAVSVPSADAGSPAPAAAPARPAAVVGRGARIDVDDQSGDGRSVVVRDARVTTGPGWIAIYADDGRLLGAAPVQPGQAIPVTVALEILVPAGDDDDDLRAVLHIDDGDGVLDPQRDPRIVDDADDDEFDYRVG